MDNKYRFTTTSISYLNYYFIFCPRYRRKIFDIKGVTERFAELVEEGCRNIGVGMVSVYSKSDYAVVHVRCLPNQSPADIIRQIKAITSHTLRDEFNELSQMQSLWTRNYFVTTEEILDKSVIKRYVDTQRTRY